MATLYSRRLDQARLLTRDDLPGVGVLAVMPGVCIPVTLDEERQHATPYYRDMGQYRYALVYSSEQAAWEAIERDRQAWADDQQDMQRIAREWADYRSEGEGGE